MDKCEHPYSEARFAVHLGMPREEIKAVRTRLKKNVEWKKNNGEIALSGRAIGKICRALRMPASKVDLTECLIVKPAEKTAVAPQLTDPRVPVALIVMRLPMNKRVLTAAEKLNPVIFREVIVGNSTNFVRGMELKAIPHPEHTGFYMLVGRPPRLPGRW